MFIKKMLIKINGIKICEKQTYVKYVDYKKLNNNLLYFCVSNNYNILFTFIKLFFTIK